MKLSKTTKVIVIVLLVLLVTGWLGLIWGSGMLSKTVAREIRTAGTQATGVTVEADSTAVVVRCTDEVFAMTGPISVSCAMPARGVRIYEQVVSSVLYLLHFF